MIALTLAAGCATTVSLPDRLDKFVEKTAGEYKNYSKEDWDKSQAEYDALVAEMNENYDSYTTSEKVRTMKAVAKYGSMKLESEVSGASETIGDVLKQIPETINEIIDQIDTAAIRDGFDGIKNGIEGIIESIDTAKLRESVEGITQNIDTARLHEKLNALAKIFGIEEED